MLQQTSDWSGTLWGTPDWADRPVGDSLEEWRDRELHEPGTHFKYNDVRVNLLAYALLQVFREPTETRPDYGYMWWLNTDQQRIPQAPESAYWAAGFGGAGATNIIEDDFKPSFPQMVWLSMEPDAATFLESSTVDLGAVRRTANLDSTNGEND